MLRFTSSFWNDLPAGPWIGTTSGSGLRVATMIGSVPRSFRIDLAGRSGCLRGACIWRVEPGVSPK